MQQVDIFTQIIVPVIGGLGIFMLGLEFMSNGIQPLAVNKMRALLAQFASGAMKGDYEPRHSCGVSATRQRVGGLAS